MFHVRPSAGSGLAVVHATAPLPGASNQPRPSTPPRTHPATCHPPPCPTSPLAPAPPPARRFDSSAIPAWYSLLRSATREVALAEAQKLRSELAWLEAEADAEGPFLLGRHVTVADVAILPWLTRANLLKYYRWGGGREGASSWDEGGGGGTGCPAVSWVGAWAGSPRRLCGRERRG